MFTQPIPLFKFATTLFLVLFSGVLTAADLTTVTLSQTASTTEIKLTLSSDTKYRYFGLSKPDRLVLDLTATRSILKSNNPSGGVVNKIRTGARNGKDLRVVFDLAAPVTAKVRKTANASGVVLTVVLQSVGGASKSVNPKPPVYEPPKAKPAAPRIIKTDIKTRRPVRVVIDAGHGGKDSGAIGPSGTREKDVALAVLSLIHI